MYIYYSINCMNHDIEYRIYFLSLITLNVYTTNLPNVFSLGYVSNYKPKKNGIIEKIIANPMNIATNFLPSILEDLFLFFIVIPQLQI